MMAYEILTWLIILYCGLVHTLENHWTKRKGEYPKKCSFCGEKKWLAKSWARFPNHVLEKRAKGGIRLLTYEAEQEWYDFIVCFHCYRIIWFKLDPHGNFEREIDLPTIKELSAWKDLPFSPVVLYDEEGNPVYGTRFSQEMHVKKDCQGL